MSPRPYRSNRREAQARRTRERVLAGATAVFLDRGYAGATVRAIATEAGVSVPTVHRDWRLARLWLSREIKRDSVD